MDHQFELENPTDVGYSGPLMSIDNEHISDCLYGPQMIDVIMRKPEFSFMIRYYNLLYQSLIPNCKLTVKTLKLHVEIPSNVENFVINGETSRIRCQRIINFLLVQLDTTRNYNQFCNLLDKISIAADLSEKLRAEFHYNHWNDNSTHHQAPLTTQPSHCHVSGPSASSKLGKRDLASLTTVHCAAADSIVIRCVDDGPSDDRADNHSFSIHNTKRRYRLTTTTITKYSTTVVPTDTTTGVTVANNDGENLQTNSASLSTNVRSSATESPSVVLPCTGSGNGDVSRGCLHQLKSKYNAIVQSLPSDYEKTLQVVQDHLTDDQICDVLTSPNYTIANKTILNCLIEKVKCTANIAEFSHQLEKIASLLPNPKALSSVITELRAGMGSALQRNETNPPQKVIGNKDFAPLHVHYHAILQLMPDDYEQSVGKLQDYISDDQMCIVLSSSNSATANKIILDCLIERINCREDLLDLCDQLERIVISHQLSVLIRELRSDTQKSIQPQINTTSTVTSEGQQQSTLSGVSSPFYHITFSKVSLDLSSGVLGVLQKNYTKLCSCLPQDYMSTVNQLELLLGITDDSLQYLRTIHSCKLANEAIICVLIRLMESDTDALTFCDNMEKVVEDITSLQFIVSLRNDFLKAFTSVSATLPITPTISISSNNIISSSPGSHSPTTLHQTSNDSSVRIESTPAAVSPQQVRDNVETCSATTSTTNTSSTNSTISSSSETPHPTIHNHTSHDSSVRVGSSSLNLSQGFTLSRTELQDQLRYNQDRLKHGVRCPQPPPLPLNYVCRQNLLNEMVTKLCQSTVEPSSYKTSLSVIGPGGFGKTSIVTALCHNPLVKEQFPDGMVFIELGPQAIDPSMKLSQLYHLLTGQYLKQGDVNHGEREINQLTHHFCRNLLVIIDDVWRVEDAEPVVKAFSSCKIVLTTRKNDIEQYIPTQEVVRVGPMEQSEAISLLTCGVINISQLSQEDMHSLDELAQDVHLWPLLLSLIRGQLSHNVKRYKSTCIEAIQQAKKRLHNKGLTAFDKNNIEMGRRYAVKACIEVTLELLSKSSSDKIKTLILWTGIGTSLQATVLHNLWNITEDGARDTTDLLWGYGLVQFTDIIVPPHGNTQPCIEVHAVISQYIIESMNSDEVITLSPYGGVDTCQSIGVGLIQQFQWQYGYETHDLASIPATDYLKYKANEIENLLLPFYLKKINMLTTFDPHRIKILLRLLQTVLTGLLSITTPLPSLNFSEQTDSLIINCEKVLKDTHKMTRALNQKVQRCLMQKDYLNLIQTVEIYMSEYPISAVAQKAVAMVKNIISYLNDEEILAVVMKICEELHTMTTDYHHSTLLTLPHIKLQIKQLQDINTSLLAGSPTIEAAYNNFTSNKYSEEFEMINTNQLIKLQEVAPNYLCQHDCL